MARIPRVVVPGYPHHVTQRDKRGPDWQAYLASKVETEILDSIARHSHTGRPLGSHDFINKLQSITGRCLAPRRPGRKPAKL